MSKKQKRKFCLPFTYRIKESGTVVYDRKRRRVVSCPTEQEAIEVIQQMQAELEK